MCTYGKKATRLCPCGYAGSTARACACTHARILRYRRALSGPLLDRIDLRVAVEPVPASELTRGASAEARAHADRHESEARERVSAAATRQRERQGRPNAELDAPGIDAACQLGPDAARLATAAAARLQWSARGFHRMLRVARTVADLDGHAMIGPTHMAEAIQLRRELLER